jgi:uncharacterized protein (DUF433 family)
MSKVVSLRLKDQQMERLQRAARQMGRTPSATAALLLEEALREREFAYIEFRDTVVGRQPYIRGTRLAIWQVVSLARNFDGDVDATASYLDIPKVAVQAALGYAAAFSQEIEDTIADAHPTLEELKRILPNLEVFMVDLDASAP